MLPTYGICWFSQKVKSIIIKMVSSAGTGYFYAAKKNPTNIQHKLAFMKVRAARDCTGYSSSANFSHRPERDNILSSPMCLQYDPVVRQHVLFTESKMVKGRGGRRAGK